SVDRADAAVPARPGALAGLRVLVCDDELDAREMVAEVLRGGGAAVIAVDSVAEALACFDAAPPDVLVSDIGMPGADGYALLGSVRARPAEAGGRVPALALTAYATADDARRAAAAGFQRHVTKPVEPDRLVAVVAELGGRAAGE
ncbi:MAG: Chemotaxis regulator, partial [Myxococcaceae bacterium]|nr:Chemotaxis regulator [Myxococcaceae bacterium]